MKGSAGGRVMAIRQRQAALDAYYFDPNYCRYCKKVIEVPDGAKVGEIRKKQFCGHSCSASFNNKEKCRNTGGKNGSLPVKYACNSCGAVLNKKRKYCDGCLHGIYSKCRYAQINLEESVAQKLRDDGWEVFSPTVVCDRVGVKNGKVYFLEFKPIGRENLRSGQQRIHDCIPEMYKIVTH